MRKLSDYEGEGGQWLGEGWHSVKITTYRLFQYNSGSPGVEFQLEGAGGKGSKVSFCLKDTILWRLLSFARACGLTNDELAKYDVDDDASHKVMVNRHVQVLIVPDGKYHKVADDEGWLGVGEPTPHYQPPAPPPAAPEPRRQEVPF